MLDLQHINGISDIVTSAIKIWKKTLHIYENVDIQLLRSFLLVILAVCS